MTSTKQIAMPSPAATAPPDDDVKASQAAHAATVREAQSTARSAGRAAPARMPRRAATATPREPDSGLDELIAWRGTAVAPVAVLEAVDGAIRRGLATPRTIVPKADPATVAAFFKSTGLSVKQIAAAVGVSPSVISTVTRENGDRWSVARFEAAKPLILAAAKNAASRDAAKS